MNHRSTTLLIVALSAGLVFSATSVAQTPIDTSFTYQGKLSDAGSPASGVYDLQFSLFLDDAGTLATGPVIELDDVTVTDGLFTSVLDFGAQFDGLKRWIQIGVRPGASVDPYELLAPLQEIRSAPQALLAQSLQVPYASSADVAGPDAVFKLSNTNATDGAGVRGTADGTEGTGVHGLATSPTGFNFGGLFECSSPDGRAVRAVNSATTGMAVAGRFANGSTSGISIWSSATSASGTTYGVYGDSASTTGTGVFGFASATTGANFGLAGTTYSTGGSGVYGLASATSGFNFGGFFETWSPDGRAVRAVNNAASGLAVAGRFATGSPTGISIWSTASATSGVNYAIFGDSLSAAGYGGYFKNSAGGTALWADGLAKVKTLQILGGADLAEPFNVNADSSASVEPGMVVVIDPAHPGELRLADQPYDSKVAGVISGANGLNPGMVMKATDAAHADGNHPVAMTGRVWCYVDASFGAIKPGDRLTTSPTPGHAMLSSDSARADGAVIGKAMTELKEGKGLVLILVNLQ